MVDFWDGFVGEGVVVGDFNDAEGDGSGDCEDLAVWVPRGREPLGAVGADAAH